ncbi:receptor/non-receptor type protein-tyrosine phosphatase [Saitoella complicata NRRL Y-17804]|nr:receptor/non-receptor type protein-tyrosine phosphatase [Saitoella complicata NRRL Y-17804]ODQ55946.1 receptor/non-receptor type protein-tyrosine phosphatase [Saitoella complicata NRRL Y-17804]
MTRPSRSSASAGAASYRAIQEAEYRRLDESDDLHSPYSVLEAQKEENESRNRYRDVLPYEHSRLKLSNGGYINASLIPSYHEDPALPTYIATQGPLPNTSGHFWQLVVEQGTRIVIMLTPLSEGGRTKCHKYWPEAGQSQSYGDVHVECTGEWNLPSTGNQNMNTLRVIKVKLGSGKEWDVYHLWSTTWADHSALEPADFLTLVAQVDALRTKPTALVPTLPNLSSTPATPLLLHCSAGVGRTGTFISIHTAIEYLLRNKSKFGTEEELVIDIVEWLRERRMLMVQTLDQFEMVNEVVMMSLKKIDRSRYFIQR